MDELPATPSKSPIVMEPEPGIHWWCACGQSANQPFCDGSHKGSTMGPVKVEILERKRVAFCNCKQTRTPPFCDGSHTSLE